MGVSVNLPNDYDNFYRAVFELGKTRTGIKSLHQIYHASEELKSPIEKVFRDQTFQEAFEKRPFERMAFKRDRESDVIEELFWRSKINSGKYEKRLKHFDALHNDPRQKDLYEQLSLSDEFINEIGSADISALLELLDNPLLDLNQHSLCGLTALIQAIEYLNDDKLPERLIEKGADVNLADNKTKKTPLHHAMILCDLDLIELLLEKGANPNAKDCEMITPLHLACRNGDNKIVKLLIKHGADLVAQDQKIGSEYEPIFWAYEANNMGVVETLIKAGVKLDVKNELGKTPLHLSCEQMDTKTIKLLLEKGADANAENCDGYSPFDDTVCNGDIEEIQQFLDFGADINRIGSDGITSFTVACGNERDSKLVEYLISKGADVNGGKDAISTPLIHACIGENIELVKLLLKNGADIKISDDEGQTPLHRACKKYSPNTDIIKLLVDGGANVCAEDLEGKTPFHYLSKNSSVTSILLNGMRKHQE